MISTDMDLKNLFGEDYLFLDLIDYNVVEVNKQFDVLKHGLEKIEKLKKCHLHKKLVEFFCTYSCCSNSGFICSHCLMTQHKSHCDKVFLIQEVYNFLKKNHEQIENNKIKSLNDNKNLQSKNLQNQISTILADKQRELLSLVEIFFAEKQEIPEEKDRKIITKKLKEILPYIKYKNSQLDEITSHENLVEEITKEHLKIISNLNEIISKFEISIKAFLQFHFQKNESQEPIYDEEYLREKNKLKKANVVQMDVELKSEISNKEKQVCQSNPGYKIAKRLPNVPETYKFYLLIDNSKKNEIKFKVKKEGVSLVGFSQFKIMKFMTLLNVSITEEIENKEQYKETLEVKADDFQASVKHLIFKKPIKLKSKYIYTLGLWAEKGYECESLYGLNNTGFPVINDVFDFLETPVKELTIKNDQDLCRTSRNEGLFPSLLYTIN